MIHGYSVLALIPARGGSKGIPRKNLQVLGGKPLLEWTIQAALASQHIDRLIISSEDPEILALARSLGCEAPFVRPTELAEDTTPGILPVLHALEALPGFDYVVLLQPTSPLRTVSDIDGCLQFCLAHGAPACVSVTEPDHNPYWMYTLDARDRMHPLLATDATIVRRQELPTVYALNGAVYVAQVDWLREQRSFLTSETVAYPMPRERSLDIDTPLDLRIAAALLE